MNNQGNTAHDRILELLKILQTLRTLREDDVVFIEMSNIRNILLQ